MYGKEIADIDLLRYKLYCSKKGKCEIDIIQINIILLDYIGIEGTRLVSSEISYTRTDLTT